jgi:hypothetical protein
LNQRHVFTGLLELDFSNQGYKVIK